MTKYEWEKELKNNLRRVPPSEVQKILDYYNELFADKAEEGMSEKEIIKKFGNPFDVAYRVLYDYESAAEFDEAQTYPPPAIQKNADKQFSNLVSPQYPHPTAPNRLRDTAETNKPTNIVPPPVISNPPAQFSNNPPPRFPNKHAEINQFPDNPPQFSNSPPAQFPNKQAEINQFPNNPPPQFYDKQAGTIQFPNNPAQFSNNPPPPQYSNDPTAAQFYDNPEANQYSYPPAQTQTYSNLRAKTGGLIARLLFFVPFSIVSIIAWSIIIGLAAAGFGAITGGIVYVLAAPFQGVSAGVTLANVGTGLAMIGLGFLIGAGLYHPLKYAIKLTQKYFFMGKHKTKLRK